MRKVPVADIFHLQWPEGIFEGRLGAVQAAAMLKAYRVLRVARKVRARGGAVVLTAHNLAPHRTLLRWQSALYGRFHRRLMRQIDLLVGLSATGLDQFVARHPDVGRALRVVVPHPHYRNEYPSKLGREDARREMALPVAPLLIGMIGAVRRSKNIPQAVTAFREIARADEAMLVAGACDDDLHWAEIIAAADGDPRIHLLRGHLGKTEMAGAIRATDICLINQSGTLNSGTALLALSLDRPLIAPAVGALPELQDFAGPEWLQLVSAPLRSADLRAAIDQLRTGSRDHCTSLDRLDPFILSGQLMKRFQELRE